MSQTKKRSILVIIILMFSFLLFGCKESEVQVEDIHIKLNDGQSQVVLLVDEIFTLGDYVQVLPNYADNKNYTIESSDESVVKVIGKQIKAIKEGEVTVKVVSDNNKNAEDVITITVCKTQTVLETPTGLNYNPQTKMFNFNSVGNAGSYLLDINGSEINIRNVSSFSLLDYDGDKYNNFINVKVKAVAPDYTLAYKSSDYSDVCRIYQVADIANISVKDATLSFNRKPQTKYDLYLNNELFIDDVSSNDVDLTSLDTSLAGENISLKLLASAESSLIDNNSNVNFYSAEKELFINVLDVPNLKLVGTNLGWNYVSFVNKYKVFIDGEIKAETASNVLDLSTLEDFEDYTFESGAHVINVVPVMETGSENLVKTNKQNEIEFSRLNTPSVSLTENSVVWQEVENAAGYAIKISSGATIILETVTDATSYSFETKPEGSYKVEVYAISDLESNYYLQSFVSTIEFVKNGKVEAQINNYILTFNSVVNERYKVKFIIDSNNAYEQTLTASTNSTSLDLSTYVFSAGTHNVEITHLGNLTNSIDGDVNLTAATFTQLEAVDIVISNSIASVTRSAINRNANITLVITGAGLVEPMETNADSVAYNTTDTTREYLSAGSYAVKAYVEGDGINTFSYKNNLKELIACDNTEFTVLEKPTITVESAQNSEISVVDPVGGISYGIYNENDVNLGETAHRHSFSINAGETKQFKARAIGDGSTTLSSICSDVVKVKKLDTPEFNFNRTTNVLDVDLKNDASTYSSYKFSFEGVESGFTFGTAFNALKVGSNNFELNLFANLFVNDTYYLDANKASANVYKFSNNVEMSINASNQLVIVGDDIADFVLDFSFDDNEYESSLGSVAGLPYSISGKTITINLLNANFNAIVQEMINGNFETSIKYFKNGSEVLYGDKTFYANSEFSTPVSLSLNKISNEAKIYTDANNRIVIEPLQNIGQCYLEVEFNILGTKHKYVSNDLMQLVKDSTILPYTYSSGKYYIEMVENNVPKIAALTANSEFDVSVKFKKTVAGSDIDSEYSAVKSIKVLETATFVRSEQSIYFTTVDKSFDLSCYKLIVDEQYVINLTELSSCFSVELNAQEYSVYTADIATLWNSLTAKISGLNFMDIHSLQLLTLNSKTTEEYPTICALGGKFHIQQAQSFVLETVKENDVTYLQFASLATDYNKTYVVEINGVREEFNTNDGSLVKINLETYGIALDNVSISGYVLTVGNYVTAGKTVYVFNSNTTNVKTVKKLSASSLTVQNNVIKYVLVSGADEYEIYMLSSGGEYNLIPSANIEFTGNEFVLKNITEAEYELGVSLKVLAKTSNASVINADLSDAIVVKKIAANASVGTDSGVAVISIPTDYDALIADENVSVVMRAVVNGQVCSSTINLDKTSSYIGIVWNDSLNKYIINSGLLFSYSESYIVPKTVKVSLEINGEHNGAYYLYSDEITGQVSGLFAPTTPAVSKVDANAYNITWANNTKNKLSADGSLVAIDQYLVRFIYNEETYQTNDYRLVYKNAGNYHAYGIITGNSIPFPYGYDADLDGEPEIVFEKGNVTIMVMAATTGYVYSRFSNEYVFNIMDAPTLSAENGVLVWNNIPGAVGYNVVLKDMSGNKINTYNTFTNSYDFAPLNLEGAYKVAVSAYTSRTDMLDSKECEDLVVYCLPKAKQVIIEDGELFVKISTLCKSVYGTYNGRVYTFENDYQSAMLGYVVANPALVPTGYTSLNIGDAGAVSTFAIRLMGNSGLVDVDGVGKVAIMNSGIKESVSTVGLGVNVNTVSSGVWKFDYNSALGTTEKTKINYNFNNVDDINDFWIDSVVYRINVTTHGQGEEKLSTIYAVDYNRFMAAKDTVLKDSSNTGEQSYYELANEFCLTCNGANVECEHLGGLYARIVYNYDGGKLYFNVYKNNVFDLQKHDDLYYYEIINNDLTYTCENSYKTINLAIGGSFVVTIQTLGGDQTATSAFLNSPIHNLETFIRYGENIVLTQNGKLIVKNLAQEGFVSPVYEIKVYEFNDSGAWKVYLYDSVGTNETAVREKFGLTANDICAPIVIENGYVAFDMARHFKEGIYNANVRTLAGIGAEDYQLNAKIPQDKVMLKVLTASKPEIKNGNLEFDLSYYDVDGTHIYTNNYEVTIIANGREYVFNLNKDTSGVSVGNNKISYILPNSLAGLAVEAGNSYEIKVRGLTTENGIINAGYIDEDLDTVEDTLVFTRENPVSDVAISNGVLTWVDNNPGSYLIKVSYNDGEEKVIIITNGYFRTGNTYTYQFTDSDYSVLGIAQTKVKINPNVQYTISVSKVGNNTSVVSSKFVAVNNIVYRLDIDGTDLKAVNGVLSWNKVNEATGYVITLMGSKNYVYTLTENVDKLDLSSTTSDDGEILPAGNYGLTIKAMGVDRLNSMLKTSDINFIKLNTVDKTKILIDGNLISWEEVENAMGYMVEFEYNGSSSGYTYTDVNSIDSPLGVVGTLTVRIFAYGESSNNIINSDVVSLTTSSVTPNKVKDLTYNSALNRFEWKADSDFIETDAMSITYSFTEYSATGNKQEVIVKQTLTYQQLENYDTENGLYFYNVILMGEYRSFTVRVVRSNALNSDPVTAATTQIIKLFEYGGGTEENPYMITNESQLNNIIYYSNSYFKILNNINCVSNYNSIIINTAFAGTIDGNSKVLTLGNITLNNQSEFGLFKSLSGARIFNLDIKANIVNTISYINSDVNIAVLAPSANSSVINEVRIVDSSIVINEETVNDEQEITGTLYIGSLFANDQNSTITACAVKLTISHSINASKIYIGGAVSSAIETNIDRISTNINMSTGKEETRFFGGVVAYYTGNHDRTKGVINSEVTINSETEFANSQIKALYFGGVFGYAIFANISNNEVLASSNIIRRDLVTDVYIGGIVAYASSSLISNNTVLGRIDVTIKTSSDNQCIGKIAGFLTVDPNTNIACELLGMYTESELTDVNAKPITLGLCGKYNYKVVINKNYTA